jgi:hemerythrin-like domain-containing protein
MTTQTLRATEVLIAEHRVILEVLDCLEKLCESFVQSPDQRAAEDILDFLGAFADRCHHGKEEGCLFPALVQKGLPRGSGPIAVMLSEHDAGRDELAAMRAALVDAERHPADLAPRLRFVEHAHAYVALLRVHISKENTVLFPMADGMLGEREQAALLECFGALEHDGMGMGTHERYLALAQSLVERLAVSPSGIPLAHPGGCCGAGSYC